MIFKDKVNISDDGKVYYVPYIWEKSVEFPYNDTRAAVVLCPGGGYEMTSDREAEPMALKYFAAGFNVFIIRYRVARESGWPNPIVDVMKAMKDIRSKAEEYNIFPDKIAIGGFSAGGHLAATLGVYWNDEELCKIAGVSSDDVKPNALILYYPVIIAGRTTHRGTISNLMQGHEGDDALLEKLSLDKHVGPHTPPTLLLSSFDDGAVPILSSLKFAEGCAENNVPCEVHIIQNGPHGLATGDRNTNSKDYPGAIDWTVTAVSWLKKNFSFLN